jgi:hypothetical protein
LGRPDVSVTGIVLHGCRSDAYATQNRDIHRFRQAGYLYLTGENSDLTQRALAGPNPSSLIWKLGYWAEAISPSAEERAQGIHAIQSDLIPG